MPVGGAVAFILKGYPRLSETFIAEEIHGLEQLGLDIHIYSLRPPREADRHPVHARIRAPVTYLPERLHDDPARLWRALRHAVHQPGFTRALRTWLGDMAHGPSPDRMRRFGQALILVRECNSEITRLHAHFLHTPASVARYASALSGLPWSCSAHARDIWTIGEREKRVKLEEMDWLVTCTAAGHAHLASLSPQPEKVELVYHGLDLDGFPPPSRKRPPRDGKNARDPIQLMSVGRAVEKKGFDRLLEALASLDDSLHWRWVHIGDGVLIEQLKDQARKLGLEDRITWLGACPQAQVIEQYRQADLFVLPCRIASDGDRDGLPNVLVEAQSQGLCCVSTQLPAITELIDDGKTGLLVPANDANALAAALARVIADPALRNRLGDAGLTKVQRAFSHHDGLAKLARRFGLKPGKHKARPAA